LFNLRKTPSGWEQRELRNGRCAYRLYLPFKTPVRIGVHRYIYYFAHRHVTNIRFFNIRQNPHVLWITDHQHRLAVLHQLSLLNPFAADHAVNGAPQQGVLETLADAFDLRTRLFQTRFEDTQLVLAHGATLNFCLYQAHIRLRLLDLRLQRLHLAFAQLDTLLGCKRIVQTRLELRHPFLGGVLTSVDLGEGIVGLITIARRHNSLIEEGLLALPITGDRAHLSGGLFDGQFRFLERGLSLSNLVARLLCFQPQ